LHGLSHHFVFIVCSKVSRGISSEGTSLLGLAFSFLTFLGLIATEHLLAGKFIELLVFSDHHALKRSEVFYC
jgi:hypothetical protein